MSIAAGVSKDDQMGVLAAIVNNFGDCTCRSWHFIDGVRTWRETCPAHAFLQEQDAACSRVQRLAFARAMAPKWQADEQTRSDEDPLDRWRRQLGW